MISFAVMEKVINTKFIFPVFLILLFLVNVFQGYYTELLSDEAYYWGYSNYLDWGYFDHPPMVAVWIAISKLFFSTGELSVRFFSAITLSVTFYIVWLLITHPQKQKYVGVFVLLLLSTSLFNVYGFITVPDTPLMLFIALFLWGYKRYLEDKSLLSYVILAISITGMLYSKYQSVLVVFFVVLSNFKVLKDGKVWGVILVIILLFLPHLYWQITNDFPSFKYHLMERSGQASYRFDYTTNHFLNAIAIIGFTFPVVYSAFLKKLKTKSLFFRGMNFIVLGFFVFFFIASFKGHVQAQWIVPISIPLIVIPFHYLIENTQKIKLFKTLAYITIGVSVFLRFAMANDILPKQLEMHGNKKWVAALEAKLEGKEAVFLNSYQNTATYWFYSGRRPYQYNAWNSRKNQFDLYSYNTSGRVKVPVVVGVGKNDKPTSAIVKKNEEKLYIKELSTPFEKLSKCHTFLEFIPPVIYENKKNKLEITSLIDSKKYIKDLIIEVVLRAGVKEKIFLAKKEEDKIVFSVPEFNEGFIPETIQLIGKLHHEIIPVRISPVVRCEFEKK